MKIWRIDKKKKITQVLCFANSGGRNFGIYEAFKVKVKFNQVMVLVFQLFRKGGLVCFLWILKFDVFSWECRYLLKNIKLSINSNERKNTEKVFNEFVTILMIIKNLYRKKLGNSLITHFYSNWYIIVTTDIC